MISRICTIVLLSIAVLTCIAGGATINDIGAMQYKMKVKRSIN